ncbi:probable LRR receptor-like serine/threonine-protein kinase At3g47570 [Salvia hispanica]|uniref:probable LRR receptor-like serine/threonine-protein kinase At3g47570 n=1 Tax=Salvia hispanica TaxID=49212 RepID=UPI002009D922|nr:probable LRR receptor-like serine/threonine-protein kinase At3g47570 [Salvia hispanica]
MDICMFYFSVLVLISNYFSLTFSTPLFNLTTDQYALTVLKNSIVSDPNAILYKNWSIHTPICGWIGVSCGIIHQRVTVLDLSSFELRGTIPPHLGNLSFLRVLDISSNSFTGILPSELSKLRCLEDINVAANNFSGEIPFGALSQLRHMDLSDNGFSGKIPSSVFNISRLQNLNLSFNILDGNIPEEIGGLSSLESVSLRSNELEGSIPYTIFNISSLMIVNFRRNMLSGKLPNNICSNNLSGSIPLGIFNITTLQLLDLSWNNFSSTLPSNIGLSLPNLQYLHLHTNNLSGPIPASINNASQLEELFLLDNLFTGFIPSFPSLRLLTRFLLSQNSLSATPEMEFLSSLTNSEHLEVVEISGNLLQGCALPNSIGNLSQSLEIFLAHNSSIRGVIPSEIGNLANLSDIQLHNNHLSGSIPLQGSIPLEFCEMSSLAELYMSNNELEGPIPEYLVFVNLSSNYLSGQITPQVGDLKIINGIDLSFNLFSGDIPISIDHCESLESISLSNNNFGGFIPQSLANMKGLTTLDLSKNSFTGMIPKSLQDLKFLEYFNVSYNKLEGEIPNGSCFSNFTSLSFVHNSALCGPARFEVPPCSKDDEGSKLKSVARLMKYILPPLFSAMAIVIIVVILIRRWKHVRVGTQVPTSLGNPWRIISYIELSRATNSFSETNLLGRGSFGSVFRGVFDDGLYFAVKVFNIELEGGNKSFETESRILSTIRHRNLVRIIGCCTNMEFKALILEIMPNGSVEKWLYSNGYCGDILQLLNISIDVALALEYLHHGNTFPIVHCDIKPSNVLLDEDMTARVADFGIAKLFEEGEAMVHTKTLATIGYAAPEYGSEGKVSTGADVYSFGIMLLEMFTRKKPTDDMFGGEMSLKEWVTESLQANEISQVLAPAMLPERDRHFDMKMNWMTSVFELAMKCLAISPDERINMIEAASTL